jgi:hypothetical protein
VRALSHEDIGSQQHPLGGARAYGFAHSLDGIGAVAFADAFSDTV